MRLKRRAIVTGVVLLTAAAGTLWAYRKRGGDPFVLSGAIEARDVEVGSLLGGRVAAVHVEEGAAVVAASPSSPSRRTSWTRRCASRSGVAQAAAALSRVEKAAQRRARAGQGGVGQRGG